MQTFGYLCSMLPLCKELYADFNTEPQLGAIIVGVTAGLEEARANGAEDVDSETINGLRAGLMGPIAGIGDSLVVGTVIPILLGIAMGMSGGGSPMGAIFYIAISVLRSVRQSQPLAASSSVRFPLHGFP